MLNPNIQIKLKQSKVNSDKSLLTPDIHLKTIEVEVQQTYEVRPYENIKPAVRLIADVTVTSEEDLQTAITSLQRVARQHVREEIDLALEALEEPAFFSAEPRYSIYRSLDYEFVVIIPTWLEDDDHLKYWSRIYGWEKRRLRVIRTHNLKQANIYKNAQFIDCTNGDLEKLPILQKHQYFTLFNKVILFLNEHLETLPSDWQRSQNFSTSTIVTTPDRILEKLSAKVDGFTLVDCRDGDFTKITLALYRCVFDMTSHGQIVLIQDDFINNDDYNWSHYSQQVMLSEPDHILEVVQNRYPSYEIIDLTDGDLSKLPPLNQDDDLDNDDDDEDYDDYDDDDDDDYDDDEDIY